MARGPASHDGEEPDSIRRKAAPDDDRQSRIGDVLRRAYDDAIAEPVPDIFGDLLRKLG
jgi:Anti-sigma factor NepR